MAPMALAQGDAPTNLRAKTARGTLINAIFMVGLSLLALVQGITLARLLSPETYGLWGMLMAAFITLLTLGSVGIDDKYIQQDDEDQQAAFEIAFTIQLLLAPVFVVLLLIGIPLLALVYGETRIIGPGIAIAFVIPALALQMPLWAHYRRMDFLRQRLLQSIDPVMTFVATITLVLVGLELWGLVIGAMIGSFLASAAMVATSPYKLRWRYDRDALREYRHFSTPLFVAAGSTVLLVQVPVIVGSNVLGVTAVAAMALAGNISQFTNKVENLVTGSMYPAICRVKDRTDLLFEAFWKSNRLALLWAAPLGAAAPLFVGDFVHHVIGEKWRFAAPLIGIYGFLAVFSQIGFNWTAFFRAVGDTKPIATASVVNTAAVIAFGVPLLVIEGITAFGVGVAIATAIGVALRLWYVRRLFPGLPFASHIARGILPTVPGVVAVLAMRLADPGGRTAGRVALEAVLYTLIVAATTYFSERPLLRESVGLLRGGARLREAPAG